MYSLKSENIILSPSVKSFLNRLERNLSFDFVVTSGTRTARQQMLAMFSKIRQGEDLKLLYKDRSFAVGVENAYPNEESATDFIQSYADQGKGSTHLRGLGVDIRTKDLSVSQHNKIIEVAKNIGAKTAIYEPVPPHLHIDIPKKKLNLGTVAGFIAVLKVIAWLKK